MYVLCKRIVIEVSVRMPMYVHVRRCLRLRRLVGPRPRASLCVCVRVTQRTEEIT